MDDLKLAKRKRALERQLRAEGYSRKQAKLIAGNRIAQSLRERVARLWR
jgi:hypothetical protein